MARHTSASGSGAFVAGLTAAALAAVAFFAYQASAADDGPAAAPPAESTPTDDGTGTTEGGEEAGRTEGQPAVPSESGQGTRVVYSLGQQRVWLVDSGEDGTDEAVTGTFQVFPSSVSPPAGEYSVSSRTAENTGSDGVAIEHAVVFHATDVVFGFSAALDGSTPDPDAEQRTGAIRQTRENGDAMWQFAQLGMPVIVVP